MISAIISGRIHNVYRPEILYNSMAKQSYQQPTVTFYGDDIIAFQHLDPNETYIVVAELCEQLGLSRVAQEKRIRSHAVLAGGARKLQVERENDTVMALCLRADLLPLWLLGVDAAAVMDEARSRLELFQRESASMLWQAFKPQGFSTEDELLPNRHEQTPAEQAYVAEMATATLARHQMLIERQLSGERAQRDDQRAALDASKGTVDDSLAAVLAQTVRRVAHTLAERSRRNEYAGVFSGLYRQFGISSYRRMPRGRLNEALEWLERWHGDLLGEPEPPPDI